MSDVCNRLEDAGGAMEMAELADVVGQEAIADAVARDAVVEYRIGRKVIVVLTDYV